MQARKQGANASPDPVTGRTPEQIRAEAEQRSMAPVAEARRQLDLIRASAEAATSVSDPGIAALEEPEGT
jgi:hypothetical protein